MADYKISQADYNILKNAISVLERKIIGVERVAALANAKGALGRVKPIANIVDGKEILTDDKMADLFGLNYNGILFYNFDAKKWNTDKYMGVPVSGQDIDTANAVEMRTKMHRMKDFANYELVAVVTMVVSSVVYPTQDDVVENPRYDLTGNSVVGTVVRRDKKTGRILPLDNRWVAVRRYVNHADACADGAFRFVNDGAKNSFYRKLLVDKICNRK
ncbi:MAG: hypothetical protein IJY99_03535 [Alphaproteobacteria bacterium]|nr:hypothetical protein [Alphaproteobacteria bacterium]